MKHMLLHHLLHGLLLLLQHRPLYWLHYRLLHPLLHCRRLPLHHLRHGLMYWPQHRLLRRLLRLLLCQLLHWLLYRLL